MVHTHACIIIYLLGKNTNIQHPRNNNMHMLLPACVPPRGEPKFQGSPFFDGNGKDKSAYASKVCAFLGLAKAKTQPETQVKQSHRENLKSIWVPDGCKYYKAGRVGSLSWTYGNQKTINGATWCLATYNKMHNDPTWGSVRCECTGELCH